MDRDVVNNIKSLSIDMIDESGSGNPGIVLSASPIIYTIYSKHLVFNPKDTNWINRDRFILSCGHGSSMLYSTLYLAGYDLTIDDLKNYRKNGKTPGNPEYNLNIGVETTTGSLGQGLATSIGIALAGKILNEKFELPKKSKLGKDRSLIDYNVYVLVSDGDLMEGISYEAASLAGTLKLNNLIVLYDSNNMTEDGNTTISFTENIIDRFKSMGWFTQIVKDGMSINDIDKAITKAKESILPSFIEVKTIIGNGSIYENTNNIHSKLLTDEDKIKLKNKLDIPNIDFYVNTNALEYFQNIIKSRNIKKYEKWNLLFDLYKKQDEMALEKIKMFNKNNYFNLPDTLKVTRNNISTVSLNNYYMNLLLKNISNVIVGSSDLAVSTKLLLNDGIVSSSKYNFKNIAFGVRENLMGAILNGLALCNFRPFGSTFLAFSDNLRASLRQTCIMNLPVTYVLTHDSFDNSYEGSIYQSVEHFSSISCIPNLLVYRPCDGKELIGCLYKIMNSNTPSCLVLSNKDSKQFETSSLKGTVLGGYVIKKEVGKLHAIIITSGIDTELSYNISCELYEKYKVNVRVVSIPCLELFKKQSNEYITSVIPTGYRTIVINSTTDYGFDIFVYDKRYLITLNKFGISGKQSELIKYMNFDYETVLKQVEELLFK